MIMQCPNCLSENQSQPVDMGCLDNLSEKAQVFSLTYECSFCSTVYTINAQFQLVKTNIERVLPNIADLLMINNESTYTTEYLKGMVAADLSRFRGGGISLVDLYRNLSRYCENWEVLKNYEVRFALQALDDEFEELKSQDFSVLKNHYRFSDNSSGSLIHFFDMD
jgi:hypothetical protein